MPHRKPTLRGTGEAVSVLSNVSGSLRNMISWDTPLKRSSDVRSPLTPSSVVNCRCVHAILQQQATTLTGAGEAVSVLTNVSWSLGKTRPALPLTKTCRKYTTPQETVHR